MVAQRKKLRIEKKDNKRNKDTRIVYRCVTHSHCLVCLSRGGDWDMECVIRIRNVLLFAEVGGYIKVTVNFMRFISRQLINQLLVYYSPEVYRYSNQFDHHWSFPDSYKKV